VTKAQPATCLASRHEALTLVSSEDPVVRPRSSVLGVPGQMSHATECNDAFGFLRGPQQDWADDWRPWKGGRRFLLAATAYQGRGRYWQGNITSIWRALAWKGVTSHVTFHLSPWTAAGWHLAGVFRGQWPFPGSTTRLN